jgi:hypothetical protein
MGQGCSFQQVKVKQYIGVCLPKIARSIHIVVVEINLGVSWSKKEYTYME